MNGECDMNSSDLAKYIDHTNLKPDATESDINKLCDEALEFKFKSVCVNPYYVKLVKERLNKSDVLVCTVIGFPLGANTTSVKVFEANEAVDNGADEIDMVINIGEVKAGNWLNVTRDISAVVNAVIGRATVKVILETCLLNEDEIIKACKCSVEAGAGFVKTSTGFSTAGASSNNVSLMRKTVGNDVGVKASGGIKHVEEAVIMLEAGANRLGTSNGVRMLKGQTLKL